MIAVMPPPARVPRKPFPIRALNGAGAALARLGVRLPSLDPE